MDLTAHVAVDALCASVSEHGVVRARQWEALCDLLGPGGLEQNLARSRPAEYLHQLAEQGARRELCQRGGLGDFWWVLVGSPARLAR
jgi:hypothetical protein